MAVWGYRSQVMHRIHLALTADFGNRAKTMDVSEPVRHVPIRGIEMGLRAFLRVVISKPAHLRLSTSVAMCWATRAESSKLRVDLAVIPTP